MTRDLFGRREKRTGPATIEELERHRKLAAPIVLEHGEMYLPIFKRLGLECARARDADDLLDCVRAITTTA